MWSLLYDIEWRSKVTPINILISGLRLAVLAAVVLSIVVAANGRVLALSVGGIQLKDEDGVTALMRAARDGERETVKALLEQGVDIEARDAYGWTALKYAAANGDSESVKALLKKGAAVNVADGHDDTPLMAAAMYGNVDSVKILIEKGADVNKTNKSGDTALTKAISARRNKVVEVLRKAGAISPRSVSGNSTVSGPEAKSPPTTPVSPLPSLATIDSRPVLLNRPQPSYTTKAREKGIQGIVQARVLIGADGTIKKCRILTGLPYGLSYQAIDAASQMRFKPAMKGGQPVAFLQAVEIEFKLRER